MGNYCGNHQFAYQLSLECSVLYNEFCIKGCQYIWNIVVLDLSYCRAIHLHFPFKRPFRYSLCLYTLTSYNTSEMVIR